MCRQACRTASAQQHTSQTAGYQGTRNPAPLAKPHAARSKTPRMLHTFDLMQQKEEMPSAGSPARHNRSFIEPPPHASARSGSPIAATFC
eukprot:663455-Prymnesium_polylepis.1